MHNSQAKSALGVLRWVLGVVILAEAIQFVLPQAAHQFSRTHMPGAMRLVIGFGEIIGCILLLIPLTAVRGAWLLLGVFTFAIVIHLLEGIYGIGNLVIYAAVAFAIATGK
jgi:uncharacterized membrane protein YphA (DoxX/SURF4 family)